MKCDIYNITNYGAKGDGKTLNTIAINQAIRDCSGAGGGTVVVPPGEYLSGPIELLKNVTLYLDVGATVKGSPNLEDYIIETDQTSGESNRAGLLTARDAHNIAITGRGVIEGNGMAFIFPDKLHQGSDYEKKFTRQKEDFMNPKHGTQHGPLAHGERPGNLIRFYNCKNVLISGVTIQNSPTWTIQINHCEWVNIEGVFINSFGSDMRVPNDDGIDLVESKYVHINGCNIQTGDDCIAIFGSEKINVSNCILSSRSSGIRVGFNGDDDIHDCVFNNMVIHTSNRGIGVFVRGKGSIENVLFSDIVIQTQLFTGHWWGKGEPIHVSTNPWSTDASQLGKIENIRFYNIIAESESGILVYGTKQSIIKNLSFRNIKIRIKNSPLHETYGGNFDLRTSRDLATALFAHDLPAIYCRYVDDLEISRLKVEWDDHLPAFFTHSIQCEFFRNIDIDGFKGGPAHNNRKGAAIALNKGSKVSIRNCEAAEGTRVFLMHSEVTDTRLFVDNDLSQAKKIFEPAELNFTSSGNRLPSKLGQNSKKQHR